MYFDSLFANTIFPDQTVCKDSSLIRVHGVCFCDKSSLTCICIYMYAAVVMCRFYSLYKIYGLLECAFLFLMDPFNRIV